MAHFALRNISKSFGDQAVLTDVTIEAEAGEVIALVGPSASGKSTLLRIAAGLEIPDIGTLWLNGQNITQKHSSEHKIIIITDAAELAPQRTVAENIAAPLIRHDLPFMERLPFISKFLQSSIDKRWLIEQQVLATALKLKLEHLLQVKTAHLSGGQRQRVLLGQAFVCQPELWLLDNPLSGLDASLRVYVREQILDMQRSANKPCLFVTCDVAEALSVADRIAVLINGRLLQCDTPVVIYNHPQHIDVARYIGTPQINVLHARASDQGIVHFAGKAILQGVDIHAGSALSVAIRPEHLQIRPVNDKQLERIISATVHRIEFLGSESLVYLTTPGTKEPLIAKTTPCDAAGFQSGMPVSLTFDSSKALLFDADGNRLRQFFRTEQNLAKAANHI